VDLDRRSTSKEYVGLFAGGREDYTVAFIIAEPSIGTKDTACVDACPVDCIHPKKDTQCDDARPGFEQVNQLFIDPIEEIAGQLDVSSRLQWTLGIALPPCRIVFVLPNPSTPSTINIHPWAAIFLPLHVVISGHDRQTEIQVQNKVQAGHEATAPALFGPVMETQALISEAIDSIAMRPSILV